ncbi:MAG: glycosyltransferase family 4 protein [Dehalococcoidia bacterium]
MRKERPDAEVRWIGKAPDEARRYFSSLGIEMLGYVEDIRPHVHDARCVIVPLRVGGGTRLKILDAWAMGKAVVSTSVGCEGLQTEDGENILIADTPEAFARATLRVFDTPHLRRKLEKNARVTAEKHYDWERLGRMMDERYRALL